MFYNPLEQFKLKSIFRFYNDYFDLSISNSTVLLFLSAFFILYFSKVNFKLDNSLNKFEILFSSFGYNKINYLVKDTIKNTKYFPFIFSIFFFILFNNLFGLLPYSFTTTSHLVINFTFSLSIILGTTILGLYLHKFKFFLLFVPSGLNKGKEKFILPLIILIEIVSYLSRVISLSVRLTANMLSGHILLSLISSFGFKLIAYSSVSLILPVLLLFPFFLLEIGIAFIQSYVFSLLTASYIKDSIYLH